MKKYLCFTFAAVCLSIGATAQTDSGYFDLGRIKLRKDFTQNITIKGSDLERMPFARLSDAIAPWLQGTISTRPNLVFVVDGVLINDVDAYSIYDIEEITLVQNALVQVSGSTNMQQVVLVSTKRKHEQARGLTIAGGSFLANNKFESSGDDPKSRTNLYHQYHISAWQNHRSIRYGASASFLRDVYPYEKEYVDVHKPNQLKRFRFNGWVDVTLGKGHSLSARINFVPQTRSQDLTRKYQNFISHDDLKGKQTLFNPSLRLSNQIARGFSHELDVSYLTERTPADYISERTIYLPQETNLLTTLQTQLSKNKIFVIRDRLTYTITAGRWQIEPAVSFMYRSLRSEDHYEQTSFNDGQPAGYAGGDLKVKGRSYVLTPALSVNYRNSISFSGGISAKIKKDFQPNDDRVFPFLSASVDVLRIARPENPYSLKIFGSYVKAGNFTDSYFTQPDLLADPDPWQTSMIFGPGPVIFMQYPQDRTISNVQSGLVFALPDNRLQLSYNFDNRRFIGQLMIPQPIPTMPFYIMTYPDYDYSGHRLAVVARMLNKGQVNWTTGLNTTGYKINIKDPNIPEWYYIAAKNNGKMRWTGGWTNQLQFRSFSFGLDLLYVLNEHRPTPPDEHHHIRINHVYAGYTFRTRGNKPFELYISSRNCLQSNEPSFHDSRRYYGAGFKLLL